MKKESLKNKRQPLKKSKAFYNQVALKEFLPDVCKSDIKKLIVIKHQHIALSA